MDPAIEGEFWVDVLLSSPSGPSTVVGVGHLPLGIGLCLLNRSGPSDYLTASLEGREQDDQQHVIAYPILGVSSTCFETWRLR